MNKLRIAKPGFNVLTETNLDNIIFDSSYNTLKYYLSGSVDLVVTGSDAEVEITHGLGFVPFFIAYVNLYAGDDEYYNICPGKFADVGIYDYAQAYADNQKLYFKVYTNSVSNTFNFRYKIFRNNTGL
jgi:hypothetical protein